MEALQILYVQKDTLSFMTDIPDIQAYADAWLKLADDFEKYGMVATAESCRSRGKHYASLTMVKATRIIDLPFAELVEA